LDARFEISRVVRGHPRKEAIAWIAGRLPKGADDPFINEKFRILTAENRELLQELMTILRGQHFGAVFPDLRAVCARPDPMYLGAGTPKRKIFFEVSEALQHRTGDDPMNVHGTGLNISENALVCCGLATHVVMLRKAVDGNGHAKTRDIHPLLGNRNDATRH
jgi:hypothetical protein